jgi:hypothetical protein
VDHNINKIIHKIIFKIIEKIEKPNSPLETNLDSLLNISFISPFSKVSIYSIDF